MNGKKPVRAKLESLKTRLESDQESQLREAIIALDDASLSEIASEYSYGGITGHAVDEVLRRFKLNSLPKEVRALQSELAAARDRIAELEADQRGCVDMVGKARADADLALAEVRRERDTVGELRAEIQREQETSAALRAALADARTPRLEKLLRRLQHARFHR